MGRGIEQLKTQISTPVPILDDCGIPSNWVCCGNNTCEAWSYDYDEECKHFSVYNGNRHWEMGTWYYNTPDHDTKRSKTDTLEAAYKWKEYEYNWKEANCAGGFCENFHQTGSYDKPNYLLKERHIVQNHTYMGWKKDAQESSLSSYPPPNKNDCPNQCWGT